MKRSCQDFALISRPRIISDLSRTFLTSHTLFPLRFPQSSTFPKVPGYRPRNGNASRTQCLAGEKRMSPALQDSAYTFREGVRIREGTEKAAGAARRQSLQKVCLCHRPLFPVLTRAVFDQDTNLDLCSTNFLTTFCTSLPTMWP